MPLAPRVIEIEVGYKVWRSRAGGRTASGRRFPPVRRALISDIHGNLEALEVVLSDIKSQGMTEILCLGDIIGYGPNPRECIDLVMDNCQVTILGNHDQGAMFD